jgi:hypothetical protein
VVTIDGLSVTTGGDWRAEIVTPERVNHWRVGDAGDDGDDESRTHSAEDRAMGDSHRGQS